MMFHAHPMLLATALALALISRPASAQPTSPPRDEPPTLDELLGLTRDRPAAERPPTDIIEKLTGEAQASEQGGPDIAALFVEAIESMEQSASLLLDNREVGLATQRFQEEAILKLDTLIAQAQQQQNQQQQPQQQQSPQQAPPQQQQQQQNQPGTEASRSGDNRPPLRQGELDGAMTETGSEWGRLPPRIRELLRQGRGDVAARLYQRLTEIYYQRLAEEAQP